MSQVDSAPEIMSTKTSSVAEAEKLILSGLLDAASDILEGHLADHPDDTSALRILARARMLQDRPDAAVDLLQRALALFSNGIRLQQKVSNQPNSDMQSAYGPRCGDYDIPSARELDYIELRAHELKKKRTYYDYETDEAILNQAPKRQIITKENDSETDEVHAHQARLPSDGDAPVAWKDPVSLDGSCSGIDTSDAEANVEQGHPEYDSVANMGVVDEFLDLPEPEIEEADEPVENIEGSDFLAAFYEEKQGKPTPLTNHDWEAIDPHLLDFDEAPAREELEQDVQTDGKINRKQRALQEAMKLGSRFGWEPPEVYLLADVFEKYLWSKAKHSMERELEAGMQPDELRLAFAAREIWEQYEEFSLNLNGYPYTALSWPMALKIVRSFHAYPEPDEIENFLLDAYAEWQCRESLSQRHRSYVDYLINRLCFPNDCYMVSPCVTLGSDYDWSEDDYLSGNSAGLNTPEYQSLIEYGLIPDIWVDPFAVRSRRNEEEGADEGLENGE